MCSLYAPIPRTGRPNLLYVRSQGPFHYINRNPFITGRWDTKIPSAQNPTNQIPNPLPHKFSQRRHVRVTLPDYFVMCDSAPQLRLELEV